MKNILKQIYVRIYQKRFNIRNIKLSRNVYFNRSTVFEDNILVNQGCHIYNAYIGRGSYLGNDCILNNTKIGRFCSIGNGIHVAIGAHPTHTWLSTHPAFFSTKKQAGFTFVSEDKWVGDKRLDNNLHQCVIGNDVWIGDRVTIIAGVEIANGCIVGTGAVLTKSTEPYGIYVGVPAKKIGTRFDSATIVELEKIKWWESDFDKLSECAALFSSDDNIELLREEL